MYVLSDWWAQLPLRWSRDGSLSVAGGRASTLEADLLDATGSLIRVAVVDIRVDAVGAVCCEWRWSDGA